MNSNKTTFMADVVVDATGLNCPMPLLKTKQALNHCSVGQTIQVLSTDVGSVRDIPAFCKISGHTLVSQQIDTDVYTFIMRKNEV